MQSNKPLIKHGYKSTSSNTYQGLLEVISDPDKELHINKIEVSLSTFIPTATISIKVMINGRKFLRDFTPVVATTSLTFGGDLVFKGKTDKPPIEVYVKSNDGSTTVRATCLVIGIEVPYAKPTPFIT